LFAASWIWPTGPDVPPAQTVSAESSPEQTIRIQSAHRWPEKVVFDTNQPTIVPPPAPRVASPPPPPAPVVAANSLLDAPAQAKPAAPPVKRHARVRRPVSRPDYYNQRPDGWHDPWRYPNAFASAGPPSWSFGRW
jgi:hypothetical protein